METLRCVELAWEGITTDTAFIRWRAIVSSLLIEAASPIAHGCRWLVHPVLYHRLKSVLSSACGDGLCARYMAGLHNKTHWPKSNVMMHLCCHD